MKAIKILRDKLIANGYTVDGDIEPILGLIDNVAGEYAEVRDDGLFGLHVTKGDKSAIVLWEDDGHVHCVMVITRDQDFRRKTAEIAWASD